MASTRTETEHTFIAEEDDWGFTRFMPLEDLLDPGQGWLDGQGTLTLRAEVKVEVSEVGAEGKGGACNVGGWNVVGPSCPVDRPRFA
jgi:hypothetical protein